MVKMNKLKKVFAVLGIFTIALMTIPVGNFVEAAGIYAGIGGFRLEGMASNTVKEGGTVVYTVNYTGDVADIYLSESGVSLNGFTANKKVSVNKAARTATITLSNIRGTGVGKYISVTGGSGVSSTGDLVSSLRSPSFTILTSDIQSPVLKIDAPSASSIRNGGTITYTLRYTDNVGVFDIYLREGGVVLNGFTAVKNVVVNKSNNTATVTLSNIRGAVGGNKSITVTGGTAMDAAGNLANSAISPAFSIAKSNAPVLAISNPNTSQVYEGGTITYTLKYSDDVSVKDIYMNEGGVVLNGFTAVKNVVVNKSNNTATVTLSNIKGTVGGNKTITVTGGTAVDEDGNLANAATSPAFSIVDKTTPIDPTPDPKPEPKPDPKPDKPSDWVENPNTGK